MEAFQYYPGTSPLLISIPHAGIHLTPAVEAGLSETAKSLPDTDWHVPKLYEFARQTGAHVLIANYSRFVIDLNRPADDQPLYTNLPPQGYFLRRCLMAPRYSAQATRHPMMTEPLT